MTTKRSSTAPVTDTLPVARNVRSMRMEVFSLRVLAAGIVGGAVVAAVYFEMPGLALVGLVALWPALSAHWLADLASRTAEHLPPKPKRAGPHWLRRLWWWFARKQVQRQARPKPWRGVKVGDDPDAIKMPFMPGESANEQEPPVPGCHGYTARDVYRIACLASGKRGLSERTWKDETNWNEQLPSRQVLTREGFRDVQKWLVSKRLATSQPYYQLTVTPEAVATELEKE